MRGVGLYLALAAGLALPRGASAAATASAEQSVAPSRAWYGQYSGDGERGFLVIHSSRQFAVLAEHLQASAAQPSLDEARETAIAVYLGQRPTGGYGVKLVSARVTAGVLTVHVAEKQPAPDSFTTQALATPYAIFVFPGRGDKIIVIWEADTH
jgi:hypothetical protein